MNNPPFTWLNRSSSEPSPRTPKRIPTLSLNGALLLPERLIRISSARPRSLSAGKPKLAVMLTLRTEPMPPLPRRSVNRRLENPNGFSLWSQNGEGSDPRLRTAGDCKPTEPYCTGRTPHEVSHRGAFPSGLWQKERTSFAQVREPGSLVPRRPTQLKANNHRTLCPCPQENSTF